MIHDSSFNARVAALFEWEPLFLEHPTFSWNYFINILNRDWLIIFFIKNRVSSHLNESSNKIKV